MCVSWWLYKHCSAVAVLPVTFRCHFLDALASVSREVEVVNARCPSGTLQSHRVHTVHYPKPADSSRERSRSECE
jgi:hypothetical protein